jgi:uncharacterized protein YcfJ
MPPGSPFAAKDFTLLSGCFRVPLCRLLPYYASMVPLPRLSIIAGFYTIILPLSAQTNDWTSVQKLAPGTSISVVKRARQSCRVAIVTESELDCDRQIGDVGRRFVFPRQEVREIRLEEVEHNRMIAGAIIGAAVGAVVGFAGGGQSNDPERRGYARIYGIPIGALIGGAIGHKLHRHGPIVYRR